MLREIPLLSGWTLEADVLPGEQMREARETGFSLPGALALAEFSDLLGVEADAQEEKMEPQGMPFSLPGMLPRGAGGRATLLREIDFSHLDGDRATLEIDHLCGSGRVMLGDRQLHVFGGGSPMAEIDLTDALRLGRRQTLSIHFDDAKNAGVCGAVLLRTTDRAYFKEISLSPDFARQTLTADIRCCISRAGDYAVRMACVPDGEDAASPWQESRFHQTREGEGRLCVTLSMRAARFEPGKPYDAPVIKLTLHAFESRSDRRGMLLDIRTLMTGYAGAAPGAYVPLTAQECVLEPDALIEYAKRLHVGALFLPVRASELLYRRAALKGMALLPYAPDGAEPVQNPCAFPIEKPDAQAFDAVSLAAACWQLCGMPAIPSVPDAQALDSELLLDASGRLHDVGAPETIRRMKALRALQLRLRAEAARQGQYKGALCAPGEWRDEAIAAAIVSAFEPLHLSVLPLRGAWWAQSFFSATLQAFIPEEMRSGAYSAEATLSIADGETIASFRRDCNVQGGPLGVIEGRLPEHSCVLTLRVRLLRSGAVIQAQEMPVYVGESGPLEAAFE